MVQKMNDKIAKIKQMILASQSRQKSFSDRRQKDLEFEVGDKVFLQVSPMKGVYWFGSRGKLRPRFVGPFDIVERIGLVAYCVALSPHLSGVLGISSHIALSTRLRGSKAHGGAQVIDYRPGD